ncbi:excalibur calcium-binding domain-containing protein [Streptomyces coeruleoprunus]|uniref:Excalibur calcium-binding domain-containing protein n=1 Tax=Streptomyces coeruleoprunus TaxID=285563 RepID=A0ABV9X8G3_9ACTN
MSTSPYGQPVPPQQSEQFTATHKTVLGCGGMVAVLLVVGLVAAACSPDPEVRTKNVPGPTVTVTRTVTATPSGTAPPALTMPGLVGDTVASLPSVVEARHTVKVLSVFSDGSPPASAGEQKVCFQDPAANTALAEGSAITLYVIDRAQKCPPGYGKPKARPRPTPTPTPTPTRDAVDDSSSATSGGSGSAYYANCSAARAAGAAPLHRGEPGYRSGLDRDNDGVACDS